MRRVFTDEFIIKCLEDILGGKSIKEVAKVKGVKLSSLERWCAHAHISLMKIKSNPHDWGYITDTLRKVQENEGE